MVLVYHNITPPEYFVDVHPLLVQQCFLGRRELGFYATRCDLALGDSEYNRQELEAAGFPQTGVLPVVPDFSHLAGPPNYMQAGELRRRLGQPAVCRADHPEQADRRSHPLVLTPTSAGSIRDRGCCSSARMADSSAIWRCCTSSSPRFDATDVHLLGHVSNEELLAYYELADVFVCASEHEGFCVPLVEAFHMGVPVIAYAATAVPATMDGGGVLLHDKDPLGVGALIHEVATSSTLQDRIVDAQDAALARLQARDFAGTLLEFVEQVQRGPRIAHPPVAFDFWDQVRQAEELEEIRAYRPAAFKPCPPRNHRITEVRLIATKRLRETQPTRPTRIGPRDERRATTPQGVLPSDVSVFPWRVSVFPWR